MNTGVRFEWICCSGDVRASEKQSGEGEGNDFVKETWGEDAGKRGTRT